MRCHEARQKINESGQAGFDPNRDKELLEHLDSCRNCAEIAESAKLLNQDLKAGGACDTEGGLSFQDLKSRVETIVDSRENQTNKESNIMSKLINSVSRRPRLGLSLGIAVLILAFLTLVPFKFDRTIGYEVAIAGVDRNLALDTEKVQTFFVQLGLSDVKFDVSNCEATCNMKITHLRSEDDAKLIVAAFDEIGNCELEEVKKIHSEHSSPILFFTGEGHNEFIGFDDDGKKIDMDIALFQDKVDGKTRIYVSNVIKHLHEEMGDSVNFWVSKSEDGEDLVIVDSDNSHGIVFIDSAGLSQQVDDNFVWRFGEEGNIISVELNTNKNNQKMFIVRSPDGTVDILNYNDENIVEELEKLGVDVTVMNDNALLFGTQEDLVIAGIQDPATHTYIGDKMVETGHDSKNPNMILVKNKEGETEFVIRTPDGNISRINTRDENALEQLEQLGINVTEVDGYGERNAYFIGESESENNEGKIINETATRFSNQIPDEYELFQNYPNPFNPSTTIIYSLPKAEHVILEIFNANGQKVRTLVDEVVSAGDHNVIWDATNENNERVATGIYMYKITAGDFTDSKKMSLVK